MPIALVYPILQLVGQHFLEIAETPAMQDLLIEVQVKKSAGINPQEVRALLASLMPEDPLLVEQHFPDYVSYGVIPKDSPTARLMAEPVALDAQALFPTTS